MLGKKINVDNETTAYADFKAIAAAMTSPTVFHTATSGAARVHIYAVSGGFVLAVTLKALPASFATDFATAVSLTGYDGYGEF